jgi:hypothetical protein
VSLDQWDLGEGADGADEAGEGEAEPGAVEEQPRELGAGEQGVGLHVAGHPCPVQLRAQLDEQSKNTANTRNMNPRNRRIIGRWI